MRYEIRMRDHPANDYVVLITSASKERALHMLELARGKLLGWKVWCHDTRENARVDETAVSDTS